MLCYAFRRNIVIGTASGIRKPMKSITDFFPSKEGSKRAASATAPQPNSPKKVGSSELVLCVGTEIQDYLFIRKGANWALFSRQLMRESLRCLSRVV
jgi:hypothetical protein